MVESQGTMRKRCAAFLDTLQLDPWRRISTVDDLMAFVISEVGRNADYSLEETLPVCLYFQTKEDREELIAALMEAKPNMTAKRMP